MKQLKKIIAAAVMSSVLFTTANASDSIRTHNDEYGYSPQVDRAYNQGRGDVYFDGPVVRGGTVLRGGPIVRGGYYNDPGVIYGGAPIYLPRFREHGFIDDQYVGRRYRDHSDNRFSRKHHSRHRNNYYGYGDYGRR